MAEGKAAAVITRLGQINREMSERRALRERRSAAAKQQAKETFQRQGQVADKTAKHLGELGRRQREAGGWATEKALADRDKVMGFGQVEDEEQPADDYSRYAGGAPVGPTAAASPAPAGAPAPQPEPPQQQRKYSRAIAPPAQAEQPEQRKYSRSVAPAQEPEPETPPPPPRRAPRHAREEERFDDDDFSNNSWLK
ncbi:hypothetical protein DI005_18800 [Prauserella sp. PE36]|uniref:Uncharacterized protein n=1 Tax=Prauserella endophytica TaxID=1592324 RepID=A0ABY2S0V6_9PSEU|nr:MULTISPECIES: hypothetical protein [Prauserella]RBM18432.1 hypothetical protein DI005_18800 [Prauserella sp. PE36]TKG67642.1 hypothetical protein FCN18_23100 [Prauserella endophytica]